MKPYLLKKLLVNWPEKDLTFAERDIIAAFKVLDCHELQTQSIFEFAHFTGHSASTVSKMLKKMGVGGWKQLQTNLALLEIKNESNYHNFYLHNSNINTFVKDLLKIKEENGRIYFYAHSYTLGVAHFLAPLLRYRGFWCDVIECSDLRYINLKGKNRINIFLTISGNNNILTLLKKATKYSGINVLITANKKLKICEIEHVFYTRNIPLTTTDMPHYIEFFMLWEILLTKLAN